MNSTCLGSLILVEHDHFGISLGPIKRKIMKVALGTSGLNESWQAPFYHEVLCDHCCATARIAFVAYEDGSEGHPYVCDLHENGGRGSFWYHDRCAVAVYLCTKCLKPTAKGNQG